MITLYELPPSGNVHKIRMFLSMLKLEYRSHVIDAARKEHKTPEYFEMHPFGQVPVLTDGEVTVRDSQAILVYLARRYGGETWLPTDAAGLAAVAAWLSTASNEMANGPAAVRAHHKFGRAMDVNAALEKTRLLFETLERHLTANDWLALGRPTIADIANYPYVALANEGRISLEPYPAIRRWMGRIENLSGYRDMPGIERA